MYDIQAFEFLDLLQLESHMTLSHVSDITNQVTGIDYNKTIPSGFCDKRWGNKCTVNDRWQNR